jgi:N-succinyldiaminopimelate aminotransferase
VNPLLDALQPYPFARLHALFEGARPPADRETIRLSVGEPQHAPPAFVLEEVARHLPRLANYPATAGLPALRDAIARWLSRRFGLDSIDPEIQVLPVTGTREALFAFAQAVVDPRGDALVMSPNPFYQIYEGAALLAGATPRYIDNDPDTGLPDFAAVNEDEWRRCRLMYLCTPGNPTGAVLSLGQLRHLIALAREFDFVLASDECYSEIYPDEDAPPPGLLQACNDGDYSNCVVFHSLSKRSNLPGLRSGFVAGDARILREFLRYRTYHGCAMPPHHQYGSISAWQDETHVQANRQAYRGKFAAVLAELDGYLDVSAPDAGFYLWPRTPTEETGFARALYEREGVIVLPGSFLGREAGGANPGAERVRIALVADLEHCVEAAGRIRRFLDAG